MYRHIEYVKEFHKKAKGCSKKVYQKIYDTMLDQIPSCVNMNFSIEVAKDFDINFKKLNSTKFLEQRDPKDSVAFVLSGIGSDQDRALNVANVIKGDVTQACTILKHYGSNKMMTNIEDLKLDGLDKVMFVYLLKVLDKKVTDSKVSKFNYDMMLLNTRHILDGVIDRDAHIDAIVKDNNGAYLSKLIYEANLINPLSSEQVDKVVDTLTQNNHLACNMYEALRFLKYCKSEKTTDRNRRYSKLYDAILSRNNPFYIIKLSEANDDYLEDLTARLDKDAKKDIDTERSM